MRRLFWQSTSQPRALFAIALFSLFSACSSAQEARASSLRVENIEADQKITAGTPAFFQIAASPETRTVKVRANGAEIGQAVREPRGFTFTHAFRQTGAFDLEFAAYGDARLSPLASALYRVEIVAQSAPAATNYFNPYILKAVTYLNKNYGLLGYNLHAQMTHPVAYHKYGVLRPTKNGFTMCVSAVLEVMVTAFNIYAEENKTYSHFDFLPFSSWSTLRSDAIKAHIWVNEKLKSAGTGDAITRFGIGERVRFRDLEPGGFVNINRISKSGHAVVFLSFIDIKGQDVPRYNSSVAGFRYFGAQGKGKKGEGGMGFRHAFFSQFGCPNVPYKRDCNIIYSEDSRLLNVGQMRHPKDWRRNLSFDEDEARREPLRPEQAELIHSPAEFNGLTTDD